MTKNVTEQAKGKWGAVALSADGPTEHQLLSVEDKSDSSDAMMQYVRGGRFSDSFMMGTNGGSTFENVLRPSADDVRELVPSAARVSLRPGLHAAGSPSPRYLVKDPTIIPCRSVGLLEILLKQGGTRWGTAWLIGPRTLATAAHNLLHPKWGEAGSLTVYLGYSGTTGIGQGHAVKKDVLSESWMLNPTDENPHDFAVLRIDDAEVGNRLGWFGFADYGDEKFSALAVNLFGYPVNDQPMYSMFGATGRIFNRDSDRVYYDNDVEEGMSGGPVFAKYGDHRIAVGLHVGKGDTGGANAGTRIDATVFDLFKKYQSWP